MSCEDDRVSGGIAGVYGLGDSQLKDCLVDFVSQTNGRSSSREIG